MVFLVLLGFPLLIGLAGFIWLKGITWKEFLLQVVAQMIVAGLSMLVMYYASTHDTEVWNGIVTDKQQVWTSCEHSYQCNCRQECSGSGKNRSCSTVCDTCYEHSNDWNWEVYTSNSESVRIHRIDRRGSHAPPRWTSVKMGEFTSQTHSYTNYVKAAPDSLFRHQGLVEKYAGQIPAYPDEVYDYYRLNRLVFAGVSVPDQGAWNADLTRINSELGSAKQVNMIVVLTNHPRDYFYALEESWLGGKKNDVVLVIGVDAAMKPQWAEVMAWTTEKLFQVKLRDAVMDEPLLDRAVTTRVLHDSVQTYFKRKPMKDFEYLKASIVPSTTGWVLSLILGFLVACGLTYLFHREDVFDGRGLNFKWLKWPRLGRRKPKKPSYMRY